MSKEAMKYITAALAAFGPDEAISMSKETWAKLREAIKTLAEQPAQQEQEPICKLFGTLPVYDRAAQQQEPVAWIYSHGKAKVVSMNYVPGVRATPLYTSPPAQRTWVELTDDDIDGIYQGAGKNDLKRAREVIAAFKERNT